jgi:hypothetical protein
MVGCLEIVDPGAIVSVNFLAADRKMDFSDRLLDCAETAKDFTASGAIAAFRFGSESCAN